MDIEERVAGDYLVVGDAEDQSTWHLPVKDNGVVNHRLMGAAWAALHAGFRGNKYEGEGKAEALKKLKALYKKEGMPLPTENDPGLPMNFSEYEKSTQTLANIAKTTEIFHELLDNIVFYNDNIIERVESLSNDYVERLKGMNNIKESDLIEVSESADGVEIVEDKKVGANFLKMHIKLIEPGWGNSKDNNYYPREMLEKYAHKFVGAKMFPVDHREDGKSVGSWVSNITDIVGFTETGAPIAEVSVIDPQFAEKVRSISAAGLLNDLQCSIMASGVAESGFELDGRKGKKVVEIKQAGDVDWVRRAGAGGVALSLIENADTVTKEEDMEEAEKQEAVVEENVDLIQEEAEKVETKINETEIVPAFLPVARVKEILAESKLSEVSRLRLLRDKYENDEAVQEAIMLECQYIDAITEAGKPFGLDTVSTKPKKLTHEEVEELKNQIVRENIF